MEVHSLVQNNQCDFALQKIGIMGLTRERKNPTGTLSPANSEKTCQHTANNGPGHCRTQFLSVILDQELKWNSHATTPLPKHKVITHTVTSHTHKREHL